ncbi:MAG: prepilin-type N-terminal cleavage/methylation domain-containing protein [Verrucomicrobiota bacterium]|nr:prepilin-type N-terminal cleavage/methylation domain-containing protein [Limisphaera sp.]MDW8381387.1 prepilin-type N-terminal cleavage/methylation domain-containing protein [Verrucomicrobiota bacterium]
MSAKVFRPAAFTLVELLITLAIVALLATLLLPALSRAKARALRAACLGNLRQLGFAWQLYADDNRDRLVPNGYASADEIRQIRLWVLGATHRATTSYRMTLTNPACLTDPAWAAFAPYLPHAAIYKCPTDKLVIGGMPKIRSYALNAYMGWMLPPRSNELLLSTNHQNFLTLAQLAAAAPSERLLFVDVAPEWLCHAAFGVAMAAVFYQFPTAEHGSASPLSFADGHATIQRWRDPWTLQMARTPFVTHLNWVSRPSADLLWLRRHASLPKVTSGISNP